MRRLLSLLIISLVLPVACSSPNDNCERYAGTWESTEEYGSPEDEGGIYRIRLDLPSGGVPSLYESDTIEEWDSWRCDDGTITGNRAGEANRIATIVDDDTLSYGRATLARDG